MEDDDDDGANPKRCKNGWKRKKEASLSQTEKWLNLVNPGLYVKVDSTYDWM